MSTIQLRNLVYEVPNKRILNNVNLEIESGKIVSIMGQSGSGKTTLLKLMTGLVKPTSGQILIGDTDITTLSENELDVMRLKMGLVFQYAALFDSLTVYENLNFPLKERKSYSEAERDSRIHKMLKANGWHPWLHPAGQYGNGHGLTERIQ